MGRFADVGEADWVALRRSLAGGLLTPGDAGFDRARLLFNARFDAMQPAAVALPATPADVAECLAFARRARIPVAIRSGGHSYAGWSGGDGRLIIDVSALAGVAVDGRSAVIGAGARLGAVYEALAAHGATIPAGTCPSVGVVGLTLGGGHGVMARAYGLACDSLIGAALVTADGRLVECDADREPELFWALRGAGNGNFGVVTELRFATHEVGDTVSAELRWPWAEAEAVARSWQEWAPDLPDELWTGLRFARDAEGEATVSLAAFSLGDRSALEGVLDRLPDAATSVEVRTEPHLDAMRRYAGGDAAGDDEPEPRSSYDVRSDFFTRSMTGAGIADLLTAVERGPTGVTVVAALVGLGGAVNRVAPTATAFVHRGHRFLAQYEAYWKGDAAGTAGAAGTEWLRGMRQTMRPHASGEVYQNAPDPQLADWRRAYYGDAADRLAAVKRAYDPDRLFGFPQAL